MHFTFKFQLAMVMKHKRDDALILLHELACMQKVTAGDASAKLLPACFAAAAQMRRRHLNRRCQTVKLPKGWIRARESIRCKRTHTKKKGIRCKGLYSGCRPALYLAGWHGNAVQVEEEAVLGFWAVHRSRSGSG